VNRKPLVSLLLALSICVVGHGIADVPAQSSERTERTAFEQNLAQWRAPAIAAAAESAHIATLPTITVRAPMPTAHQDNRGSVMVEQAVDGARAALSRQVDASMRRVSLAFPYYAFGTRRAAD
jgi:hypothetical protein